MWVLEVLQKSRGMVMAGKGSCKMVCRRSFMESHGVYDGACVTADARCQLDLHALMM